MRALRSVQPYLCAALGQQFLFQQFVAALPAALPLDGCVQHQQGQIGGFVRPIIRQSHHLPGFCDE